MALAEAFKEGIWLSRLLLELGQKLDSAYLVHCDNRGAVALAANPGLTSEPSTSTCVTMLCERRLTLKSCWYSPTTLVINSPAFSLRCSRDHCTLIIELEDVSQVRAEGIAAARGSVE
jgi:hypothetical protein